MSDMQYQTLDRAQERAPAIAAYVLYLLGISIGVTTIIGLILAYVRRPQTDALWRSHYTFLIRTFWLALLGVALGAALMMFAKPAALILSALVMTGVGLWALARVIVGLLKAIKYDPIPDPRTLSLGL